MQTGSYIAGEWLHPESSRVTRNINPANLDETIAEFPSATSADAERAIESARNAFPGWSSTPAPERGRILWRAAEIARSRSEEIAQLMTREEGKIIREARGEVQKGINVLEFYAGEGFRIEGKTLPSEVRDTFTCTIRRPLGVVGLITPWNFPWAIPCWKIAPALVAGNSVVFKPAELTPGCASLLVEIFEQAGLPAGVLNMVVGPVFTLFVALFLVYDVLLILNGDHRFEFSVDDHMFAALNLHFDVMNMVYLLVVKFLYSKVCRYVIIPLVLYVSIVFVYMRMLVG